MRFDVNCSMLFTELPLLARPAAAKAAGFDAIEMWWPFAEPVPADRDVDAFVRAIEDAGVRLVLLNFDGGDIRGGDRGFLCDPAQVQRVQDNVDVVAEIAARLDCLALNALYGNEPTDVPTPQQREVALDNLSYAARAVRASGARVVCEALNAFESPRYPITTTAQALALCDDVATHSGEQVSLLYDAYHMQRMEGNLIATIRAHVERFGHVQIADSPQRGAPGTGEINFANVLGELDRCGYQGYVGCEYTPDGPSAASFGWRDALI